MKNASKKHVVSIFAAFCLLLLLSIPVHAKTFEVSMERRLSHHFQVLSGRVYSGVSKILLNYPLLPPIQVLLLLIILSDQNMELYSKVFLSVQQKSMLIILIVECYSVPQLSKLFQPLTSS